MLKRRSVFTFYLLVFFVRCATSADARQPLGIDTAQTSSAASANQDSPQRVPARNLRPVNVVGVVPGPDMWRVRHGSHVLWILGTLDELPEHIRWRAREVRQVIAQAGEVLDLPRLRIHASNNYFDRMALNPDGRKLRDVVTPQDYERWLSLKATYMGNDQSVENARPIYAAIQLYLTALKRAGLAPDRIEPVIADLLKQHGLTPVPVAYRVEPTREGDPIGDQHMSSAMEMQCFEATLDHLEGDLDVMEKRAEAWSSGDLEDLQKLPMSDQLETCRETVVASGESFKVDVSELNSKLRDAWILAARNAIASHKVSFAMLPMSALFGHDNYLEALRDEGYVLEVPDNASDLDGSQNRKK